MTPDEARQFIANRRATQAGLHEDMKAAVLAWNPGVTSPDSAQKLWQAILQIEIEIDQARLHIRDDDADTL